MSDGLTQKMQPYESGDGPWVICVQVFGASGNFDTLYRTIYRLGVE